MTKKLKTKIKAKKKSTKVISAADLLKQELSQPKKSPGRPKVEVVVKAEEAKKPRGRPMGSKSKLLPAEEPPLAPVEAKQAEQAETLTLALEAVKKTEGRGEKGFFAKGNKLSKGREPGVSTNRVMLASRLGEETVDLMLKKTRDMALFGRDAVEGDPELLTMFVTRLFPAVPHKSFIKSGFDTILKMEDVNKAMTVVIDETKDGEMALEDASKLSDILKVKQGTIEASEWAPQIKDIKEFLAKIGHA